MKYQLQVRLSSTIVILSLLLSALGMPMQSAIAQDPIPVIVAENLLPGSPPSEWDVSGAGDPTIQGFATDISVNRGGTIEFKIDTTAAAYTIPIYRLGYYSGNGARLITTITPHGSDRSARLHLRCCQPQPARLRQLVGVRQLAGAGRRNVRRLYRPADAHRQQRGEPYRVYCAG